ncbi:PREDICTED: probable WRKY transcription factor 51 isoform X2 [Nicotiana attenuata]|uniref:Wrky transcription factor 51 n=1 Tax=Nicotiana attenuata TaxID=49451 RepID=A0A1J6L0Y9_NICAT|nr:PREDICTED: probable WRKY transcription factor 51 isoform X2 [Nicotiana attenuata]OIT27479.1 putative wrky transcription factor 51 [Nicotiana attenuata]
MFGSSTFQETTNISHQTINPNFAFSSLINMNQDHGHNMYQDFDTSFLDNLINDGEEYSNSNNSFNTSLYSQNPFMQQEISTSTYSGNSSASSFDATPTNIHMNENSSNKGIEKEKKAEKHAIAFRTKTELEILDDGYKWRKYGKKKVKSNTNPRNYYKCSSGGCKVKKKVERDGIDSSYLITTYEGKHNHESPFIIYCHEKPTVSFHNDQWTLQADSLR